VVTGNRRRAGIVWSVMQPAMGSQRFARVGIVWLVAAVVALAGCTFLSSAALPGSGPIVTVQMRGGVCPDGMCDTTVVLDRDGRVHSAAKPPNDLGRATPEAYAALEAAIRTTDFAAARAKPFTGACPVAFDGQELIFEFSVGGGTKRLASCETEIDWGSPLFIALAAALGEWIALPLT
jgi:hypothetical protein